MRRVVVDGVEYEVPGRFGHLIGRVVLYPLGNYIMPRWLLRAILRRSNSPIIQASLKEAGGWESMSAAYENAASMGIVDHWVQKHGAYPMAIRNRRKLCGKVLERLLAQLPDGANIVALGEGSGSNVLEPMARVKHKGCRGYFIDLNPRTFEAGWKSAEEFGIGDLVEFIEGDAIHLEKIINVQPHLVIMVGILEYIPDEHLEKILEALFRMMPTGGTVMASTLENYRGLDRFLRRALDFSLIYRDTEDLRSLMHQAGFSDVEVDSEPVGIYDTVVGYKRGKSVET